MVFAKTGKRGFVFILDALLAASLAALLYVAVTAAMDASGKEILQVDSLRRTAQDVLNVAEKLGILDSLVAKSDVEANSTLCGYINSTVPTAMNARIKVKIYGYSPDGDGVDEPEDFVLERNVGCDAFPAAQANQSSKASRQFAVAVGSSSKFGVAALEVWYK